MDHFSQLPLKVLIDIHDDEDHDSVSIDVHLVAHYPREKGKRGMERILADNDNIHCPWDWWK